MNGKVDLNDHIKIVLRKCPSDETDGDKGGGWDEDGQHVAHDRPPQGHLRHYGVLPTSCLRFAHTDAADEVSVQGDVMVVLKQDRLRFPDALWWQGLSRQLDGKAGPGT